MAGQTYNGVIMPRLVIPDFTVVRDTREHPDYIWEFKADPPDRQSPRCLGSVDRKLDHGDYSIIGYEDIFCIEKKKDLSELWTNFGERKKFEKKMCDMQSIKYRFLIIEAVPSIDLFKLTPPQYKTNVPGKVIQDWLCSMMINYNIPILFEGDAAKQKARLIMNNIVRITRDRWVYG